MDFPSETINFNYADTLEDAKLRFGASKETDPLPNIPATLLNKRDIAKYVSATGMIWPFNPSSLKAASYEVKLGKEILFWDKDGKQQHKQDLKDNDPILLKRNSITFVSVEPKFFVPFYIALRFNLSITHVHRGLLLGTGPLIDPTFIGRIMIPIHNLTNNDYTVRPGDDLIAVEFTKIWFDTNDHHEINFDKMTRNIKKPDMTFVDYFKNALPENINTVESSLEQTVEKAKRYVEQSETHIKNIKEESIANIEQIRRGADRTKLIITGFGLAGATAIIIATIAIFVQVKSVVSDANNYVASSSNALQGNIKLAYDPKGFDKAIYSTKQEVLKVNQDILNDIVKNQNQIYKQFDIRLGYVTNRNIDEINQLNKNMVLIKAELESIKATLSEKKEDKYNDRINNIYQLLQIQQNKLRNLELRK